MDDMPPPDGRPNILIKATIPTSSIITIIRQLDEQMMILTPTAHQSQQITTVLHSIITYNAVNLWTLLEGPHSLLVLVTRTTYQQYWPTVALSIGQASDGMQDTRT